MVDVIISPSSQTANQYAGGGTGVEDSEHRHMRDIAPLIHDLLQRNGVNSKILWSTDLYTRIQESNAIMPLLHFALHSNAGGSAYGAGTYIYQRGTKSEVMAYKVQARLAALTPWSDNGVVVMNHYETRTTKPFAVIAEVAFHDKVIPAQWIRDNKRPIAIACAQGIIDALAAAYGGKFADIAARPLMIDGGGGMSPIVTGPDGGYTTDYIKEIQRLLNDVDGAGLLVDGILGPITVSAVAEYQTVAGLVPDGDPGPITLAALRTATQEDDMALTDDDIRRIWRYPVRRNGKEISAIQELADAKTLALKAEGERAGLLAAIQTIGAGGLDMAVVAAAITAAVEDAVGDLRIVKAGD